MKLKHKLYQTLYKLLEAFKEALDEGDLLQAYITTQSLDQEDVNRLRMMLD